MRESRTYGSGRGACHETHVPTATKRREFITLLGGAAAAWPLAARGAAGRAHAARRRAHPVQPRHDAEYQARNRGVPAGACSNWAGPTAATCVSTSAGPQQRRQRADTRQELVALAPDVILASGSPTVRAVAASDPHRPDRVRERRRSGRCRLRRSLARPGGNATGFTSFEYGMSGKWLELLKEIAPGVTRVAVLRDPTNTGRHRPVRRNPGRGAVLAGGGEPGRRARRRRDRARDCGIRARPERRPDRDAERTHDQRHRDLIITLAARHRLPAVYSFRYFVHRRRPDFLRARPDRSVPARGRLCRPHSQGREAGRPAGAGADQVRAGDQPQDRQGARPRRAADRCSRAPTR